MLKAVTLSPKRRRINDLILSVSLVILLGFLFPAITLADPPDAEGPGTCAKCHEEETDTWLNSPHAKVTSAEEGIPGATCVSCHGSYAKNHPKDGLMRLSIDSSVCEDCHASTFTQWEDTKHAEAGVQCIGCHLSHSQAFRVSEEKLCVSCHRDQIEEGFHDSHATNSVPCVDCHVSPTSQETALASNNLILAPSHDFTDVTSEACVECHRQNINLEVRPVTNVGWEGNKVLLAESDPVPKLVANLETTQQENEWLESLAPMALGLGMGIGIMLGIILMLVIGYIDQRRATG